VRTWDVETGWLQFKSRPKRAAFIIQNLTHYIAGWLLFFILPPIKIFQRAARPTKA
jgi:hypothetical protein